MDQRFLDETVSRRGALFAAMVEFNRLQLRCPDSSTSSPSNTKSEHSLLNDASIRRAYRKNAGSTPPADGWWDFSDETYRLVLLSPAEVKRLALCFSAAVFAEKLALVIDGKQVLQLRSLLGNDIFSYAIRRGRYQVGSIRKVFLADNSPAPLAEHLLQLARNLLLLIGESWPDELRTHWLRKLAETDLFSTSPLLAEAASSQTASPLPQLSREQRRAIWFTLKKILLREAAPQWAPCFD